MRDGEVEHTVEKILESRVDRGKLWYHIQWKGYGPEDNTWEPEGNLANAKELVKEFHKKMPNAPQRIPNARKKMRFRAIENFTDISIPKAKKEW
jgi:hypothetical protein